MTRQLQTLISAMSSMMGMPYLKKEEIIVYSDFMLERAACVWHLEAQKQGS